MRLSTALTLGLAAASASAKQKPLSDGTASDADAPGPKVNVSLYAMSRCPDARLCESVFEEVLNHDGIADKINLEMNYIGTVDDSAAYGVSCMHGDLECSGNAHQLCMNAHLALPQFYGALSCMNYGRFPGAIGTLSLARRCVETAGGQWWETGLGRCIQGREAERQFRIARRERIREIQPPVWAMETEADEDEWEAKPEYLGKQARRRLRRSVQLTKKRGVTKSCTIHIESTLKTSPRTCIVDGGVWKGCDDGHEAADFVRVINKEWDELRRRESESTERIEDSWDQVF